METLLRYHAKVPARREHNTHTLAPRPRMADSPRSRAVPPGERRRFNLWWMCPSPGSTGPTAGIGQGQSRDVANIPMQGHERPNRLLPPLPKREE